MVGEQAGYLVHHHPELWSFIGDERYEDVVVSLLINSDERVVQILGQLLVDDVFLDLFDGSHLVNFLTDVKVFFVGLDELHHF